MQATAAVLVVKPWNGKRVGSTIVMELEAAKRFSELGYLRLIDQPEPPSETKTPDLPMKGKRKQHGPR